MQKSKIKDRNCGVVALVTVLMLGAVLTEIALAGVFVVYVSNNSSFGLRSSAAALVAAQSGVDDALLRLVRNKDEAASYQLSISSVANVSVTIVASLCGSSIDPKIVTVESLGSVGFRRRKLQAGISVHCGTGEVRVVSIKEIVSS